ncbi:MAG: GntR family transcriptional regulator [bacterium]|nr:GntR family transcriptional regulator [bacterium]
MASRYLAIAEEIERELAQSNAPDGLASERDLAERFKCQRGTVRRALQLLESRGSIYRRGRSGWYRSPARLDYVLTGAPPLAELTAQMGRELKTEVITNTAPPGHRPPDGMVFVARRLRRLDGWPIVVEDIHLRPDLVKRIEHADLRHSTKAILAAVDIEITFEQATLEVVAAPQWVIEGLGLRVGGSLLEITRQRFIGDDLVQSDIEWWRSQALRLHVAITGDSVRSVPT